MFGLNKVIRVLIASDFLLQSGWGLIGPIFAIFITQQVKGGSLEAVGFAAATYWITKSFAQPFIARFLDVKKGEGDDFKVLVMGMYIANLIPIGYLFSTNILQIFFLEFIRGLAMACVIPAWAGIFTRHIKKGWEAFSWSIESTSLGFAFGLAAAFGGVTVAIMGFKIVFILASILGILSSSILFLIRRHLLSKDGSVSPLPPTQKPL